MVWACAEEKLRELVEDMYKDECGWNGMRSKGSPRMTSEEVRKAAMEVELTMEMSLYRPSWRKVL